MTLLLQKLDMRPITAVVKAVRAPKLSCSFPLQKIPVITASPLPTIPPPLYPPPPHLPSGFLSGTLGGCFVILTAMVRAKAWEPEDTKLESWLDFACGNNILISCDCWKFTRFLVEKH